MPTAKTAAGSRPSDRRHTGEYVRIPARRQQPLSIAEGSDEEALVMLSDILPTGFEIGVLSGQVKPATPSLSSAPVRLAWRRCSLRASTARDA